MTHMIEINDSKNNLLTVELYTILDEIGDKGSALHWSIFYLWATGDLGDGKSIVDLEEQISKSKKTVFIFNNNALRKCPSKGL